MKKTHIVTGVVVASFALSACTNPFASLTNSSTTPSDAMEAGTQSDDSMMEKTDGDAIMEKTGGVEPQSAEQYVPYSESSLQQAQQNGKTVLFFHANWCPSCRAADKDITNNLSDVPEGVTILKTDFDKEKDLKKKYGVVSQHTFVQVDENGNELTKWSGGSLSDVVDNIR